MKEKLQKIGQDIKEKFPKKKIQFVALEKRLSIIVNSNTNFEMRLMSHGWQIDDMKTDGKISSLIGKRKKLDDAVLLLNGAVGSVRS